MKVILYMAITANGMIAKRDDDTSWVSKEEWKSYSTTVLHAGCLVVGRKTYDIMVKESEFVKLKDVFVVVVSHQDVEMVDPIHKVAHTPQEALELLKDYPEVIVGGGGHLNSAFLKEKLIDEMYLDVEPKLIGDGIRLFEDLDNDYQLVLLDTKNISPNVVQLHYKVAK